MPRRRRGRWLAAAVASAGALTLVSSAAATSDVRLSSSQRLSVSIFPDSANGTLLPGKLLLEPFFDSLHTVAYRVRPLASGGNTISTSDGDCLRNPVKNDVVCNGSVSSISVSGSGLADRVSIHDTPDRASTCLSGDVVNHPMTAEVHLADGDDRLHVESGPFNAGSICPSGTVLAIDPPVRAFAFGDGGADHLEGSAYGDEVSGGSGDDEVLGLAGADVIHGDSGADDLDGGRGTDDIDGGSGDDLIHGREDTDNLDGGDGNDNVLGDDGVDNVHGGTGNDTVVGGADHDFIFGDEGDDTLLGVSGGPDEFGGGSGFDTVTYAGSTENLVVALDGIANDGAPGEGDSVPASIERIVGGDRGDFLFGSFTGQTLEGGPGDDTIVGNDGGDTILGGPGVDNLVGDRQGANPGTGDDTILARDGTTDLISCGGGVDLVFRDLQDPFPPDCEGQLFAPADDGLPSRVVGLRIRGTVVRARVSCPKGARIRCRGAVTLALPSEPRRILAAARYTIRVGTIASVPLTLTRREVRTARREASLIARTQEKGISRKGPRGSRLPIPLRATA